MPSHLHERVVASLEDAVMYEIARVSQQLPCSSSASGSIETEVVNQLSHIYKARSATVHLATRTRSPDSSFYHLSQPHLPCLIIEVGYSQTFSDLRRLAKSYITDSCSAIRCVVGVNLPYPSRGKKAQRVTRRQRRATVSIWRANPEGNRTVATTECGIQTITADLRDRNGAACSGTITLHINDLLPPATIPEVYATRTPSIEIPFANLNSLLSAAEGKKTTKAANAGCVQRAALEALAKRKYRLQAPCQKSKARAYNDNGEGLLEQGLRRSPRKKAAVQYFQINVPCMRKLK